MVQKFVAKIWIGEEVCPKDSFGEV